MKEASHERQALAIRQTGRLPRACPRRAGRSEAAPELSRRHGFFTGQAQRPVPRRRRAGTPARHRRSRAPARAGAPARPAGAAGRQADGGRRAGALGRGWRAGQRHHPRHRAAQPGDALHQGQVDGQRGDRAQSLHGSARHDLPGVGHGRVHRAAGRREAVAHRHAGDTQDQGGHRRPVRRAHSRRALHGRRRQPDPDGPARAAPGLRRGRHRPVGRELRGGRHGHPVAGGKRGQWPPDHVRAGGAHRHHGHGKGGGQARTHRAAGKPPDALGHGASHHHLFQPDFRPAPRR